jgi:DNA-binding CsgD family transcriptional regulator
MVTATRSDGWSRLFADAFQRSRNAMLLTDERRVVIDANARSSRCWGGRAAPWSDVLFVALSVSRWAGHFRRAAAFAHPPRSLSRREREVVHLVSLGATGPEIADELVISPETVRTHVRNAMEKLGARSRAHLVAKSLAEGHLLG